MTDQPSWTPEACTLPTAEQPLRVAEFDDVFATALRGVHRDDPTRLRLDLDPCAEAAVRELTEREAQCCSFFTFTFDHSGAQLQLDVQVPAAYTDVLDALARRAAGAASSGRSQA